MLDPLPCDARHHRPGTVGESGRCSWHGLSTCAETPIILFQDRQDYWQSGCQRALDELTGRGEIRAALVISFDGSNHGLQSLPPQ